MSKKSYESLRRTQAGCSFAASVVL